MAQGSRIPKFGGWVDSNGVSYTAYFENARKEKLTALRVNPNDPEENPEAFACIQLGLEAGGRDSSNPIRSCSPMKLQFRNASVNNHGRSQCYEQKEGITCNGYSTVKRERRDSNGYDYYLHQRARSPKFSDSHRDNTPYRTYFESAHREKRSPAIYDHQENLRASRNSVYSRSPSKPTPLQKQFKQHSGRTRSVSTSDTRNKRDNFGALEGISPSVRRCSTVPSKHRIGDPSPNKLQYCGRATTVPVFGDWDESDPNSGEGYTDKFKNVMEEKGATSSNLQPAPAIPITHSDARSKHAVVLSQFKKYCCVCLQMEKSHS